MRSIKGECGITGGSGTKISVISNVDVTSKVGVRSMVGVLMWEWLLLGTLSVLFDHGKE